MLALIGGALVRFIPSIGAWLGERLGLMQDDHLEEKAINRQIRLEEIKAKSAIDTRKLDYEALQAITGMQAGMAEMAAAIQDRKSAREFSSTVHRSIVGTLALGEKMGLSKRLLGFGWWCALMVEVFTASVQPGIAAVVFAAWAYWKYKMFAAFAVTAGTTTAALAIWTLEDWMLLEAVIGFFLAGRALVRDRNGSRPV